MDNLTATITELKKYTILKKDLEKQIKELEDQIKNYMAENGLQELISDDLMSICRYKEVITKRIDTAALKAAAPDVYEAFLKETASMRFTIN